MGENLDRLAMAMIGRTIGCSDIVGTTDSGIL